MKQPMKNIYTFLFAFICIIALVACSQNNTPVSTDAFSQITGEYQCIEEDISYMHLSIWENEEESVPWLSIYDNEAGNPGVEGEIIKLDDASITIQIDIDLFDEMPPGWQEDGETLTMDYRVEDENIILSNQGVEVRFQSE